MVNEWIGRIFLLGLDEELRNLEDRRSRSEERMKCIAGSPYPFRYTKRVERYSQRTRLTRVFLMRNVLAVLDLLGVILDLDPCRDHGSWTMEVAEASFSPPPCSPIHNIRFLPCAAREEWMRETLEVIDAGSSRCSHPCATCIRA